MANNIHLVMRFSAKLFNAEEPIEKHRRAIDRFGSVWFGKMGKPLARTHIKKINSQCSDGIKSYLYLVEKGEGGYRVYRGSILSISRDRPDTDEKIPGYYRALKLLDYIRLWISLGELVEVRPEVLNRLRVVTSGFAISETLRLSMAAMFIACD